MLEHLACLYDALVSPKDPLLFEADHAIVVLFVTCSMPEGLVCSSHFPVSWIYVAQLETALQLTFESLH